jgi:hypothetical protein
MAISSSLHPELEALAQAARSDRLLIFVGAGLSAPYNLPGWRALATSLENDKPNFNDLPGEFSRYVERRGRLSLNQLLERKLGRRPATTARATRLLLETRCVALVSTNCDRVLEAAADHEDIPFRIFCEDGDLVDFHSTPGLRIVKLHGTLDRKETLVFTKEDFAEVQHRIPAIFRTVSDLMSYCHVLFLGYSLSDPDLRPLLQMATFGRPDRMAQMVGLFTRGELDSDWRRIVLDDHVRLNASLIELTYEDFGATPSDGLTTFLERLQEQVSPRELPSLSRQTVIYTNGYTATLKSEATQYLANCLGIPVLGTHRYGGCTTPSGLLDASLRERRYRELLLDAEALMQRGHSVVLDGTFADPAHRQRLHMLAKKFDAQVIAIKTRCEDEWFIRSRLWRRRIDHSRSEHEVIRIENFRLTYDEVGRFPLEADQLPTGLARSVVSFDNSGDRTVRVESGINEDVETVVHLLRISPLMSVRI